MPSHAATRLGVCPGWSNVSQVAFAASLRAPRPGSPPAGSWTRELERLETNAAAARRQLAHRSALIRLLLGELRGAEREIERAADAAALSNAARELLLDEVRALRAQLDDLGHPRYAEAAYIAQRARDAIAERDDRVAALQAALSEREAELRDARSALALGARLSHEARVVAAESTARERELRAAEGELADTRAQLRAASGRAAELEEALAEAHARLRAHITRTSTHARARSAEALRAELLATAGGGGIERADAADGRR